MKFIEERVLGGKMCVQELLDGGIARRRRYQFVTPENAPGVSVSDEDRPVPGVKENGVRGFRSDTVDCQQLVADLVYRPREGRGNQPVMTTVTARRRRN